MAAFKVCAFRNHLRKDGTYNTKLRITHNFQTLKKALPFTSRKKISPRIFRSRMMSMSIFVKISVMNAEESPESQGMKSTTMTIDELVHYLIQWTIYDIYQAGPSQRSSNRLRAKTSKGSPNLRALSLYLACM